MYLLSNLLARVGDKELMDAVFVSTEACTTIPAIPESIYKEGAKT